MTRLAIALAMLAAACGRVDFAPLADADVGPCNADARAGSPFATDAAPYLICTADQLDQIGAHAELWGSSFVLGADLDVTARAPVPHIGNAATPFAGSFDGGGHTITGLHYDEPATLDEVGLFGTIDPPAHLANLTLAAVDVHGAGKFTGALVGYGQGATIENIAIDGTIIGVQTTGGLVGGIECYQQMSPTIAPCPDGTTIRGIHVNAMVVGSTNYAGVAGVIGYTYNESPRPALVSDVHVAGTIVGPGTVGGLIADGELFVLDVSDSSATVMATAEGAGLVAVITYSNSVVERSFATGDVICTGGDCGGAIGDTDGAGARQSGASGKVTCMLDTCGGFAGDMEGPLTECYATGAVTGHDLVGGLAGLVDADVSDSFATGAVTGHDHVGGLVGNGQTIARSYATGRVMASGTAAGGLLGTAQANGVIQHSFVTGDVSGVSSTSAVGLLVGEKVGTYTSDGNVTANTCANTTGSCTTETSPSTTDVHYFDTPGNPPMSTWNFTSIWQAVANAKPTLRNAPR